ncbi:MAG TPA: hypothetical protein VII44_06110, partial [Puia sp.]
LYAYRLCFSCRRFFHFYSTSKRYRGVVVTEIIYCTDGESGNRLCKLFNIPYVLPGTPSGEATGVPPTRPNPVSSAGSLHYH